MHLLHIDLLITLQLSGTITTFFEQEKASAEIEFLSSRIDDLTDLLSGKVLSNTLSRLSARVSGNQASSSYSKLL